MEKVKIAICGACLVIVAILGYCYISEKQNEKYEYIVNSAISNIVDTVIEKYPDVREEEILNILRNTKNNKTNILKKYGYLDNENYIKIFEDEKNVDSIVSMQQKSMFLFQNSEIIIIYCGGNIGERGYTLMLDRWKGMQLTSDQEAPVNEMLSDLDKCDQGLVNKWRAEGHSDYWIAMMLRNFG